MIEYSWYSITPSFSSASQLKSALLGSFIQADIDYAGGAPVIMYVDGRDWSGAPAWGWLPLLLRTRSDWWPSLGIAIQYAVADRGALARTALDDVLKGHPDESLAILEWIAPLAKDKDDPLATRIAELVVTWDAAEERGIETGDRTLRTAADLEALMKELKQSKTMSSSYYWLVSMACAHRWVAPALPEIWARMGGKRELATFLERGFDAWRYRDIVPLDHKHRRVVDAQAATPAVLDLAPLFPTSREP